MGSKVLGFWLPTASLPYLLPHTPTHLPSSTHVVSLLFLKQSPLPGILYCYVLFPQISKRAKHLFPPCLVSSNRTPSLNILSKRVTVQMTHSITLLSSFYFFNAFEHCQALTFSVLSGYCLSHPSPIPSLTNQNIKQRYYSFCSLAPRTVPVTCGYSNIC